MLLEEGIMTPDLYISLRNQQVNLNDNYNWSRQTMIQKVCAVMGIKGYRDSCESSLEPPQDPDETYVLNVDNVTKLLAIKQRFR